MPIDDNGSVASTASKVNGSGCSILDNAERIRYPQAARYRRRYQAGGAMAAYDIEEIVAEGKATHTCPFHTAQVGGARAAHVVPKPRDRLCPLLCASLLA